ncbi:MAG: hypothetical protein EBT15_04725 [Betaproteobacteria bacterium]|nr:hypothetical protein [Betaproteobacteria bacterium]
MVATLSQLMAERHPEVELTRGVFHDLVLYFDGLLNAAIQENIDRVQQSNSLLKITENPSLADPTTSCLFRQIRLLLYRPRQQKH